MEAIDFLKNKGITKATCYTDGGTYYVSELAKLMEEYATLRQPLVSVRDFIIGDVVCTEDGRIWVINEIDGEDLLVDGNGKRNYPLEKCDVHHAH